MLSVRIGNMWLSSVAPYGPVTVEFGMHGSEAASWEMSRTFRHPALRGNAQVGIYDGGVPIWSGTLIEPGSTGEYSARGAWRQAEGAPALTFGGAMTTVPDDAINGAYMRGEIQWSALTSISSTPWAAANGELSLSALLDGYGGENALRWVITPTGLITFQADPTTPQWVVPHAVAGQGLTPADDEFATHLIAKYFSATDVTATYTVGSAEAAAAFGRRTKIVDLTDLGVITQLRAAQIVSGMFLLSGARMGWGEGLELSYGQITTAGGVAAPLAQVQAGQMIRLAGTVDTSRANLMPAYTDVVIASSKYTDGSNTISLTPVGYAARTLGDVIEEALEDA